MRLTKKKDLDKGKPSYFEPTHLEEYSTKNKHLAVNKLGKHEDIEDDCGMDLIVLFKTLKSRIYVKNTQGIRCVSHQSRSYLTFGFDEHEGWYFTYKAKGMPQYFVKDLGKTWAFTKEELL